MPPFSAPCSVQLKSDLIASLPRLRAFAVSLCGNADRADDLVQETMVKAWRHLGSFVEGSNLRAWLCTILRNHYFSECRNRRREVPDSDGVFAGRLAVAPGQTSHMDMLDLRAALALLPAEQREALILVVAAGHSYEEAAAICDCPIGTVKSRVNRARLRLAALLSPRSSADARQTTEADDDDEAGILVRSLAPFAVERRRPARFQAAAVFCGGPGAAEIAS